MLDQIVIAELWRLSASLEFADLVDIVGDCDPRQRHIRVALGMTLAETRSTTMHELGHLHLAEFPTDDMSAAEYAEMEANADRWAAERLITAPMLAWAQAVGRTEWEMAEMLGVDDNLYAARCAAAASGPPIARVISVRTLGPVLRLPV